MHGTPMGMEQPSSVPRNRNVFFVGLLSFFGGVSQDIFAPVLPIYLTTILGFDKTFVGIAEGIVTASANIAKVVSGFIADKFKKQKPLIFVGYLFSMVSRPLLAAVSAAAPVFALRFMDGVGKGVKDPPKDVLIAGSAEKTTRGRSFGVARMLDTLGSVVGPLLLAALLYLLQGSATLYHTILVLSAIPLIVTLTVLVTKVREAPREEPRSVGAAAVSDRKLPTSFYLFLAVVIVFTLGNSSDAFLVLRAKNLGFTLVEIPIAIALSNLVYALGAVPFGSLSDRIGRIPTLLIGWFAYAAVYLGFALASQPGWVWLLYAAYGVYYATSEGVARAFLADIVGAGHRGRAFGIYGTAVGLATLPASFFAGLLWDRFGPPAPFYFGAAMATVAVILLVLLFRSRRAGGPAAAGV